MTVENLATACTDAQVLGGDGAGGVECQTDAGGSFTFDVTDTDASPILTVDDGEQVQYIGAGTVSLEGVRFADGIVFDFTGAAVADVAPGGFVLAVKNVAAFEERYGPGLPVAGEYLGQLSNGGERIEIVDAVGRRILAFTYDDAWHPSTDGGGYSLAINDPTSPLPAWSTAAGWHPSLAPSGSPAAADPPAPLLGIDDATVIEGDSGNVEAVFHVSLSVAVNRVVSQ